MTARTDPAEPNRAVIEQAAMWQARFADEECDAAARAAFDHWLNEHPSHRIAFDRMSSIADRLSDRDAIERTALQAMLSPRSRRNALGAIVLLGGAGLAAWMASYDPSVRARVAGERTTIGEIRQVTLAKEDRVTLDSDSAADIDETGRSVRLWRGGVMANVTKGSAQPFVIRTSQGTARALGTRFSVRIGADATIVAVIESSVEACANQVVQRCLTLGPGQSARLDRRGVQRLADIDPATETAWSDG
jgi:transmembrane sensor